jgi:GNAT superfamily N-acetyltransferase
MVKDIIIREYEPGDLSFISYLQMKYYKKVCAFKGIFEYYLLDGMVEFLKNPLGSQFWAAVIDDKIVGSIAVFKRGDDLAQLRWFIVDETVQGKGIGNKLMGIAMKFCKDRGYKNIYLWTGDMLPASRHLYKKYGFIETESKKNTEWTNGVVIEEKLECHII